MALYRVDVHGVSQRYVEAPSAKEAEVLVREAFARALDLRAARAERVIESVYDGLGPVQRRRLLTGLDGLVSHVGVAAGRQARRRLARLVKFDYEHRQWIAGHVASAPAADPQRVAQIVRLSEAMRLRELRSLRDLARDE